MRPIEVGTTYNLYERVRATPGAIGYINRLPGNTSDPNFSQQPVSGGIRGGVLGLGAVLASQRAKAGRPRPRATRRLARKLFKMIDVEGDGLVDFGEVRRLLESKGRGSTRMWAKYKREFGV